MRREIFGTLRPLKVNWGILRLKIAPALKSALGYGDNGDQLWFHNNRAGLAPIRGLRGLESDNFITALDEAFNDPIYRAAIEQLICALGRHTRDMDMMGRLPFFLSAADNMFLPVFKCLDGLRAD